MSLLLLNLFLFLTNPCNSQNTTVLRDVVNYKPNTFFAITFGKNMTQQGLFYYCDSIVISSCPSGHVVLQKERTSMEIYTKNNLLYLSETCRLPGRNPPGIMERSVTTVTIDKNGKISKPYFSYDFDKMTPEQIKKGIQEFQNSYNDYLNNANSTFLYRINLEKLFLYSLNNSTEAENYFNNYEMLFTKKGKGRLVYTIGVNPTELDRKFLKDLRDTYRSFKQLKKSAGNSQ